MWDVGSEIEDVRISDILNRTSYILHCPLLQTSKSNPGPPRLTARRTSSGDHTGKETPVPIPNTAVKLSGPMIVPTSAKVGIARFYLRLCRQTPPIEKIGRGFCFHTALVLNERPRCRADFAQNRQLLGGPT